MKILTDNTIRLRAVEPSDAYPMWEMEQDSEQWIHNGMAAPYSIHNLREYADNYDADPVRAGQLRLIIEHAENGTIIGVIDLYDISALHQTAFVGVYIKPEFRRKGYALKSLALLEEYAYKLLNLYQIGAKVMGDHSQSIRLFEKARYTARSILPDWFKSGNRRIDLIIFTKTLYINLK